MSTAVSLFYVNNNLVELYFENVTKYYPNGLNLSPDACRECYNVNAVHSRRDTTFDLLWIFVNFNGMKSLIRQYA